MSAMHMKKIEELTLYLIQQNESMETMKAELENLKLQLATLKN